MCYSIEPRYRRYVKGYGFLSFGKNNGKNIRSKYSQKLIVSAKKRAIQKTEETTGDLIANKIADKITSVSKNLRKSCSQKNCI